MYDEGRMEGQTKDSAGRPAHPSLFQYNAVDTFDGHHSKTSTTIFNNPKPPLHKSKTISISLLELATMPYTAGNHTERPLIQPQQDISLPNDETDADHGDPIVNETKHYHKRLGLLLLLIFLIVICEILNITVIQTKTKWFKGNTHTHTLWSDGNDFPDMVASWYKNHGYNFLALSDHNILSKDKDTWMKKTIIESRKKIKEGPSVVEKYKKAFGDWVETRGGEGNGGEEEIRLKTLTEIQAKLEENDTFLLIQAEEISDTCDGLPVHINALNLQEVILPQNGASNVETVQNDLKVIQKQAEETGKPIFKHINHPNFYWVWTAQELAEIVEAQFLEIYNGHPDTHHLGDDSKSKQNIS